MCFVFACECVFTCLCLGPPRAFRLGSGLKRNSLYWGLPTCGERTERKRQWRERESRKEKIRRADRGCNRRWQEGRRRENRKRVSKTMIDRDVKRKGKQAWRQHHSSATTEA